LPSEESARADEPQFLGRTRKDWVKELDKSSNRRRRTHAAWGIAEMAIREAKPSDTMVWLNELLLLCEDESPAVRYWGQMGLARFIAGLPADHPARPPTARLLSDAVTDSAIAVRLVAAETLVTFGPADQGLGVLVEALEHPQESVRIAAIAALQRLGPAARPAEADIRKATTDSSEYVKRISTRLVEQFDAQQE
jgi:HEAT repeat protein